jgi:hypothetical protein
MLMLKTTHDRLIDEAVAAERAACKETWAGQIRDLETQILGLKTRLSAEESISARRLAEIDDKAPLYDLGVREQASRDKQNADRKAERAAKRKALK